MPRINRWASFVWRNLHAARGLSWRVVSAVGEREFVQDSSTRRCALHREVSANVLSAAALGYPPAATTEFVRPILIRNFNRAIWYACMRSTKVPHYRGIMHCHDRSHSLSALKFIVPHRVFCCFVFLYFFVISLVCWLLRRIMITAWATFVSQLYSLRVLLLDAISFAVTQPKIHWFSEFCYQETQQYAEVMWSFWDTAKHSTFATIHVSCEILWSKLLC